MSMVYITIDSNYGQFGHVLNSIHMNNGTLVYIEPQTDAINQDLLELEKEFHDLDWISIIHKVEVWPRLPEIIIF